MLSSSGGPRAPPLHAVGGAGPLAKVLGELRPGHDTDKCARLLLTKVGKSGKAGRNEWWQCILSLK